jgi:hypothetical protein
MRQRAWAAGMVMVAAVAVSTAPVATAVARDQQAPKRVGGFGVTPLLPRGLPCDHDAHGWLCRLPDVLVMTREGLVLVTDRGQSRRQCQLTPEATQRLRTAASQVPWARITPDDGQARFPDDMWSW